MDTFTLTHITKRQMDNKIGHFVVFSEETHSGQQKKGVPTPRGMVKVLQFYSGGDKDPSSLKFIR